MLLTTVVTYKPPRISRSQYILLSIMATEQHVQLRWVRHGSKRHDGKQEDVSIQCAVHCLYSALWKRTTAYLVNCACVLSKAQIVEPSSVLELALLVKRTCCKPVVC